MLNTELHFLIRGRGWLAPVADLHSRSWSDIRVFSLSERNFRIATDREGANKSKLAVYIPTVNSESSLPILRVLSYIFKYFLEEI